MPNEQEKWWNDPKFCQVVAGHEFAEKYDMPAVIAEAQRRAKLSAWEEANELMKHCLETIIDNKFVDQVFQEKIKQYETYHQTT
jgi:hypothetical protein